MTDTASYRPQKVGCRLFVQSLFAAGFLFAASNAVLAAAVDVTVQGGRLYVDGVLFESKGIGYNASYIGSDLQDPLAAQYDIPRIAQMHGNNVVTYIANRFEWGGTEYTSKLDLQDAVSDASDAASVFTSIGFWSPTYIDYTNPSVRNQWGNYYKEMVNRYKTRHSTLMWVIGNEVINNLPNEAQKNAYADWVEELTQWTHINDPNHPVSYADAGNSEIARLTARTPSLDLYGTNYYDFETAPELSAYLTNIEAAWPGVTVFLHEYGSDSYNHATGLENEAAQAQRISDLVQAVYDVTPGHPFVGGAYFEFSDEWKFVGAWNTQDPGNNYNWQPTAPFDHYADEDYWGIAKAVANGQAQNRVLKSGYYALQAMYQIPEPGTAALTGLGMILLLNAASRHRNRQLRRRPTGPSESCAS